MVNDYVISAILEGVPVKTVYLLQLKDGNYVVLKNSDVIKSIDTYLNGGKFAGKDLEEREIAKIQDTYIDVLILRYEYYHLKDRFLELLDGQDDNK